MNGSLEDYYGMQAQASGNPYLPSGPMSLTDWAALMREQGLQQGTRGQDMGDGLGGVTTTNNFRLPDGNWLKPTVQNGMVTGTRAENIGLGENIRDGLESMAPFLAVAGTAGTLGHLGYGAASGASAAGGLLDPMTMPAALGGGTTASVPVGTGTVLANNAASGGGLLSGLGSAFGDSGINWGGVLGGIGSAYEASQAPDTLTTTSTNSLSPEAQGHMNTLMQTAQGRMNSNPFSDGGRNAYSGSNPYMQQAINSGVDDLARGYQQIGQTNDATLARGNAFGGSAWNQQNADNQRAFGTAAGNLVNNFRMGDYQAQQQLDENRLNRQQTQYNQSYANYANAVGNNAQFNRVGTQQGNNPAAGNPFSAGVGGFLTGSNIWNSWGN